MPWPHRSEALSDDAHLTTVCLRSAVTYMGPKSRAQRHRKAKIGTEVARTPLSRLKGQLARGGLPQSSFKCGLIIKTNYLLVRAHTTTSLDYSYDFLNIAREADCERVDCYDVLTYLPYPNPCFALGSRLDRQ